MNDSRVDNSQIILATKGCPGTGCNDERNKERIIYWEHSCGSTSYLDRYAKVKCYNCDTSYLILEAKLYNPNYYIYENGMFALNTNSSECDIFDESDIEEQIFYTNYNIYNLKCNFWKPKEENITILCKIIDKKSPTSGSTNPDYVVYKYKDKTIKIIFNFRPYFTIYYLPFLYADK